MKLTEDAAVEAQDIIKRLTIRKGENLTSPLTHLPIPCPATYPSLFFCSLNFAPFCTLLITSRD